MRRLVSLLVAVTILAAPACAAGPGGSQGGALGGLSADALKVAAPDAAIAAAIFGREGLVVSRHDSGVPGWTARQGGTVVGEIGSTWEIAGSVGYSGRPLDVLVGVTPDARIAGARLMAHNEPVLTLGISDADIAAYVNGFAGYDLAAPRDVALERTPGLPDVISRATVSTGVIRDGILRTARTLAIARGYLAGGGGIDRLTYTPADWPALVAAGALAEARIGMTEAAGALAGAKVPLTPGPGDFLHIWTGLVDPPAVGQNLLGQQVFTQAIGSLGAGETGLVLVSSGLYSHRGTGWKRSGVFDRVTIVQGDTRLHPEADGYQMVKRLAIAGAPEVKEVSLFRLPPAIDPMQPFSIEVTATREADAGDVALTLGADYRLPDAYRLAPVAEPEAHKASGPAPGAADTRQKHMQPGRSQSAPQSRLSSALLEQVVPTRAVIRVPLARSVA